jgi:hypothetical protein
MEGMMTTTTTTMGQKSSVSNAKLFVESAKEALELVKFALESGSINEAEVCAHKAMGSLKYVFLYIKEAKES